LWWQLVSPNLCGFGGRPFRLAVRRAWQVVSPHLRHCFGRHLSSTGAVEVAGGFPPTGSVVVADGFVPFVQLWWRGVGCWAERRAAPSLLVQMCSLLPFWSLLPRREGWTSVCAGSGVDVYSSGRRWCFSSALRLLGLSSRVVGALGVVLAIGIRVERGMAGRCPGAVRFVIM
jgi:hypothetical protein